MRLHNSENTNDILISYSVAIRTIGTAGEKYKKLLQSIQSLDPKPKKVVVVLPEGYTAPVDQLGYEEIVYSPKGMVAQRLEALKYIDSEYVLFCDDDVSFNSDFVKKLADPLLTMQFDCSAGPLLEFLPPAGLKYVIASVLGGACTMLRGRKDTYIRILRTGGWSYNRNIDTHTHKIYKTDSLPWTCFFIRRKVMEAIHFEDESWCEKSGYAAFEDRVMFYKLKINGFNTCVVSDALYQHNDAKTSTQGISTIPFYARAFNHYIFWYRFLYEPTGSKSEKIWLKICINYYIFMQSLYSLRDKVLHKATLQGFIDAKKFVHNREYKELPSIVAKRETR